MICVIHCISKPNVESLRAREMQRHRDYLDSKLKEGLLVFSGPVLADDGETVIGGLFMVNVKGMEEAKAFSSAEPFTSSGVYGSVNFLRVRKGRWNPAAANDT